jgi:membrane-associated phospholipid phosphatase
MNLDVGLTKYSKSVLLALTLTSNIAAGQGPDSATHKTFYTQHDGAVAAVFLAASAGLSLFDARIAKGFQDTSRVHVRFGRKADDIFTHINETTLTVGSLAVYTIARFAHARTVADVAFHTAESVVATSLTAQVIRGPLGRTRPRDAERPFEDQYDFHFFQGFTHFQNRAFPSIHSASGFAAASAIVAEVRRRNPGAAWAVGVPAYALALTPGLSRMYLGQHWASDIFAGAFLGTFYGWRVVDYSHTHRTTPVDRLFLGTGDHTNVGLGSGGLSFRWGTTF